VLVVGEKQVPESARARLLLELLHDRRVEVRLAGLLELLAIDRLGGIYPLLHERPQALLEVLGSRARLEVHAAAP
jgi:hypothetical protein